MSDFNQPAYPTTPEHYGYSPDFETRRYSSTGLTMLQRVASEQLAALVLSDNTTDSIIAPMEPCDMKQDDNGLYTIRNGNVIGIPISERDTLPKSERYALFATHYERIARQAVKYAKALLEITQ